MKETQSDLLIENDKTIQLNQKTALILLVLLLQLIIIIITIFEIIENISKIPTD